jgi:hypothetical protein
MKSWTIDFNSAFVQSDLPEPIYLELPPGYGVVGKDKVYRVDKSLFGNVRAARLWYKHLTMALLAKLGFVKSEIDSCLYLRDSLIFVFYVDDGIIISPDDEAILRFIDELCQCGFDLGIEADYAGYLGSRHHRTTRWHDPDGTIWPYRSHSFRFWTQRFCVFEIHSCLRGPWTLQGKPPFDEHFNYRSVLG